MAAVEEDCGNRGGAELASDAASEDSFALCGVAASCCFMASQGLSVGSSGGAGDTGLSELGATAAVAGEAMELVASAAACENVCCQREAVLWAVLEICWADFSTS